MQQIETIRGMLNILNLEDEPKVEQEQDQNANLIEEIQETEQVKVQEELYAFIKPELVMFPYLANNSIWVLTDMWKTSCISTLNSIWKYTFGIKHKEHVAFDEKFIYVEFHKETSIEQCKIPISFFLECKWGENDIIKYEIQCVKKFCEISIYIYTTEINVLFTRNDCPCDLFEYTFKYKNNDEMLKDVEKIHNIYMNANKNH